MITFHLPDMTCGHCAARITLALKTLDPLCRVEFDLSNRTVKVFSDAHEADLTQALREAGYPPA
ncbi:MAG TPA: heavy-metal-associated domain-containing protein [Aquabacterium sp.]|nr:heavy-metal-associated domain-containing protein [Aquabacterium sp.]